MNTQLEFSEDPVQDDLDFIAAVFLRKIGHEILLTEADFEGIEDLIILSAMTDEGVVMSVRSR